MEKIKIEVFDNGRYRVYNARPELLELVDEHGHSIPHKNRFTLCGCGHSKTVPFCDGSHKEQE